MTRRYPAYRDSGVEWLGEVPAGWEVKRLRLTARLKTDKATTSQNPIALENIESWSGRIVPTDTDFQGEGVAFERGDILFGKLRPYLAKVAVAEGQGEAVGDFHVFEPSAGINSYFLQRHLLAPAIISVIDGSTYGSKMPRASWDFMADLQLAVPPLPEQTAIAAFLDRETAKIDALVAEQRRLIDLLREKRQAVISHAVTRGLNPSAKLKPSGVDWLGDVPEGWEVVPLKRLTLEKCDGPFGSGLKSEHYVDAGTRVIRLQNIKADGFSNHDAAFIDPEYASAELSRHEVIAGDLLIAGLGDDRNLVGRACVAPIGIEPAMVKADCFRFRLDLERTRCAFIAYQLNSSAAYDAGTKSTGTTRSRIPLSQMAERMVSVPSLAEQGEIVAYVASMSNSFDELTLAAEAAITLLQERRAALISAAVTGKIDVRDLVAAQTEAA